MVLATLAAMVAMQGEPQHGGPFRQDIGFCYTVRQGLPSEDVRAITISGRFVWAGTAKGIVRLPVAGKADHSWKKVSELPTLCLAPDGEGGIFAATEAGFYRFSDQGQGQPLAGLETEKGVWVTPATKGGAWCLTAEKLFYWEGQVRATHPAPQEAELAFATQDAEGNLFVGARLKVGGYSSGERGMEWTYVRQLYRLGQSRRKLLTQQNELEARRKLLLEKYSDIHPAVVEISKQIATLAQRLKAQPGRLGEQLTLVGVRDTRGRYADGEFLAAQADDGGHVWVGTRGGLAITDGEGWWYPLTGREGMPVEEVRCITLGQNGDVWVGTPEGACRLREGTWNYFWGKRWMPGNNVRAIAIDQEGGAWLGTNGGVGHIESRKMTLAEKARHYEEITTARHNRNGYVTVCRLADPNNLAEYEIEASDNDGLWTALYTAAECFRYAVTKEPEAKERARKSMRAIMDLERLSGIPGFPARAVVRKGEKGVYEVHGEWHDSPVDPQVRWKGDTSSDELDGHYFIYPIYYDLVADETEKVELRAVIQRITDHLLKNSYRLVDRDGQPTRWATFGPAQLNDDPRWEEERGLNSLSILAYLKVAHHMTGEARYADAYEALIREHHYLLNLIDQKRLPPYEINHSDDELAFLGYHSLLRYETDPLRRRILLLSLERSWQIERPERSAFFNFVYGAMTGKPCDAEEAIQTLRQWPWDLRHWTVKNSHRNDIRFSALSKPGQLECDRVLPHSERRMMQWSDNPYLLDGGDDGHREYDGAAWLLPYWMGRYYGIIED